MSENSKIDVSAQQVYLVEIEELQSYFIQKIHTEPDYRLIVIYYYKSRIQE